MNREKYGNLNLFSVPDLYRASKSTSYREHTLIKAEAISYVFTTYNLSVNDLSKVFAENPEQFSVCINDLTNEGIEFGKFHFQSWLKNTDRWKTDHSVAKYTDSMIKQVENFRAKNS